MVPLVAHGARVIGVVLSGLLDDGTAGSMAIKRCGGVTVVQDPKDAAYSPMPQSAVDNVDIDYCVAVADMGALLMKLASQPRGRTKKAPRDVRTEALIAERVLSDVKQVNGLGAQVPYNCPNCGGVLWGHSGSPCACSKSAGTCSPA
jgi:two-component system chemotaxis response regulator CheB